MAMLPAVMRVIESFIAPAPCLWHRCPHMIQNTPVAGAHGPADPAPTGRCPLSASAAAHRAPGGVQGGARTAAYFIVVRGFAKMSTSDSTTSGMELVRKHSALESPPSHTHARTQIRMFLETLLLTSLDAHRLNPPRSNPSPRCHSNATHLQGEELWACVVGEAHHLQLPPAFRAIQTDLCGGRVAANLRAEGRAVGVEAHAAIPTQRFVLAGEGIHTTGSRTCVSIDEKKSLKPLTSLSLPLNITNGRRPVGIGPATVRRSEKREYSWLARAGMSTTPTSIITSTARRPGRVGTAERKRETSV